MNKLLLAALVIAASAQAETLEGNINRIDPTSLQIVANAQDDDNTGTAVSMKVCWDDPTFTVSANCSSSIVINGGAGHGFPTSYSPATLVSGFNPNDGLQHKLYMKIISPTSSPANDVVIDGSPYPYRSQGATTTVGALYTANLETSPAPLTPASGVIFANSNDTYSVGSTGSTVCTVSGTAIKSDGAAAIYAAARGMSCSTQIKVVTVTVASTITEANFTSQITPTLTALSSSVQWIGIAWAQPAQVISTAGGSLYPNTVAYVMATGGVVYNGPSPAVGIVKPIQCGTTPNFGIGGIWRDPVNPYFNSTSKAPFTDLGFRPTMMLVGETCPGCNTNNQGTYSVNIAAFTAALNASVAADNTNPTGATAYWARTSDGARSILAETITSASLGSSLSPNISGTLLGTSGSPTSKSPSASSIMYYANGADIWANSTSPAPVFLPGAIAYHVTSFGATLPAGLAQTLAPWWLNQGAAATYGTYTEPCTSIGNKFPRGEIVVPLYSQGQTAIEAVWKAVPYGPYAVPIGDPMVHAFTSPAPTVLTKSVLFRKVAFRGATPAVSFTMGSNALSSLSYLGQSLLWSSHAAPLVNQCTYIGGTTCSNTPLSTSTAGNTITSTYTWGTVAWTYAAVGNKLTVTTVVNNTGGTDIAHLYTIGLGIQFPSAITNASSTVFDSNIDGPSSNFLQWATGAMEQVNEDVTLPLYNGWQTTTSTQWQLFTNFDSVNQVLGNQPPIPRNIAAGGTDTYTLSARFGSPTDTEVSLGGNIFTLYKSTYPQLVSALPFAPIGDVHLSTKVRANYALNPRGWFNNSPTEDVTTTPGKAQFKTDLLTYADNAVTELQRVGAQGVIIWDIEGQYDDNIYIGDPSQAEAIAPELVGAIDPFIAKFTTAGLSVGFLLRPQPYTHYSGVVNISGTAVTWVSGTNFASFNATCAPTCDVGNDFFLPGTGLHYTIASVNSSTSITLNTSAGTQAGVAYWYGQHLAPGSAYTELSNKISYCNTRWGATLFYIDSNLLESSGFIYGATIYQALQAAYPTVSIFPEQKNPRHYAYSIPYLDPAVAPFTIEAPVTASEVYSGATNLVKIDDTHSAQTSDMHTAICNGSVLLWDAWYRHTAGDNILAVYGAGCP